MTAKLAQAAMDNAKFFPEDSEWQKHCAKVAAYLDAIPAITSKPGWDSRRS